MCCLKRQLVEFSEGWQHSLADDADLISINLRQLPGSVIESAIEVILAPTVLYCSRCLISVWWWLAGLVSVDFMVLIKALGQMQ